MAPRARWLALLTTAALGAAAPPAAAEVRSGSAPDPAGDSADPAPARDILGAQAGYDSDAGTFALRLTLAAPADASTRSFVFGFVGSEVSGGCGFAEGGTPTTRLGGGTVSGDGFVWNENAGTPTAPQPANAAYDGATVSASVTSPSLAGRPYTCVRVSLQEPGGSGTVYDSVALSVLPQSPTPQPTPTPPPTPQPSPTPVVTPPSPDADAPPVRGSDRTKRGRASGTVIYGICGKNLCRVDPRTRRLTTLYRARGKDEYQGVSASPSGRTLAFSYGDDVFRASRDGRGRTKIGEGIFPAVSPDGRSFAWIQYIVTPLCVPNIDLGLQCQYPLAPSLQRRGPGEADSTTVETLLGEFAWYRGRTFLAPEDPDEGEADFICELKDRTAGKDEGDCLRPVAVDPARFLSTPSVSPDGRYLAVVSEPVPADSSNAIRKGRIALYSPATGRFIRYLTTSRRDDTPIFSPDGRTVAFNRGKDLLTVPTRGGSPSLVKRNMALTGPSWAKRR